MNAHFISKKLGQKLKEINKQSMLHFIFNPKIICVLITYDIDQGEFVLQIPNFHQELLNEKECFDIITKVLNENKQMDTANIDIVKFINNYIK
jgi:hypothetical protein